MRTQEYMPSKIAEEGENEFAPTLGQCRSSHGAVQLILQDDVAEQL